MKNVSRHHFWYLDICLGHVSSPSPLDPVITQSLSWMLRAFWYRVRVVRPPVFVRGSTKEMASELTREVPDRLLFMP